MKDPIETVVRALMSIQDAVPSEYRFSFVVCSISAVAVFTMCVMFTDVWIQEERINQYWTSVCDEVISEVESLLPVYRREMMAYAKMMKQSILVNKGLTATVASIEEDIKIKAERDFCLIDVRNQATVDMLQAQFERFVQQCRT